MCSPPNCPVRPQLPRSCRVLHASGGRTLGDPRGERGGQRCGERGDLGEREPAWALSRGKSGRVEWRCRVEGPLERKEPGFASCFFSIYDASCQLSAYASPSHFLFPQGAKTHDVVQTGKQTSIPQVRGWIPHGSPLDPHHSPKEAP